ncbi:MAG: hypothetical protein AAFR15_06015 [Cyanobacteria bacterium J06627_15]
MTNHANNTQRLMATSAGLSLAALGIFSSSAQAVSYHLDFNNLYVDGVAQTGSAVDAASHNASDKNIDDEWSNWGVDISGVNYRSGGTKSSNDVDAVLRLYDTSTRGGQDRDLETGADYGTTDQGNALIIQKHSIRNSSSPNDDANGGEINMDFTNDDGSQKLVNFDGFTLLDVELDEHNSNDGINVYGYNTLGEKVLDIDVDALVTGFYNKYAGQYNASNHGNTNKTKDGVRNSTDPNPSYSFGGVTITQEGEQLGNNTVFRFDIDPGNAAAQGLSDITFQYADVSGAVSGVRWSDVVEPEEPEGPTQVPEPSALAGLVMVGAYGVRKYRQRKADRLANAMGLDSDGPQFS